SGIAYNATFWNDTKDNARNNDGAVFVYAGSNGGITDLPAWWIAGADADDAASRLGEGMATGDLDGDGIDDLALAAPYSRVGGVNDAGRVIVFAGGSFPANPLTPSLPSL